MNKIIASVLLITGIALILVGINVYQSVSSSISRLFTNSPSNKAIWILTGGIAASVAGFLGLIQSNRKNN